AQTPDGTNLSAGQGDSNYTTRQTSFVATADTTNVNMSLSACIDSSKIAVGDQLTARTWFNGVEDLGFTPMWGSRTSNDPSPRSGSDVGKDMVVDQSDIDYGVAMNADFYKGGNFTAGTNYALTLDVQKADGTSVVGDCTPAVPAKPVLTVSGTTLTSTFNIVPKSTVYSYKCVFYEVGVANPIATSYNSNVVGMMQSATQATCRYNSAVPGKSYTATVAASWEGDFYSAASAASDAYTVPIAGITVNTPSGITNAAGKVSKVSDTIDNPNSAAMNTFNLPDGGNGQFIYSFTQTITSCPPCGPSSNSYKILHATASGIDAGFAGTGSVILGETLTNKMSGNLGWYGTNHDKWAAVSGGTAWDAQMNPSSVNQVMKGDFSSATRTTLDVPVANFTSVCSAAAAGYTAAMNVGGPANLSVVSANTANPLYMLTCYKTDPSAVSVSFPILIEISDTGVVTALKVFGGNVAGENGVQVRFSTNPNATGTTPSLIISVVRTLASAPAPAPVTIVSRDVMTMTSSKTFSTYTAVWNGLGTTTSTDYALTIAPTNDGAAWATLRFGTDYKLVKFLADGTVTAPVTFVPSTQAALTGAAPAIIIGATTPSNSASITLRRASGTAAQVFSVNTTTGAVTEGEILTYTTTFGVGTYQGYVLGADKNVYMWAATTTNPGKYVIYKWIDPLYVVPAGPVPTLTSQDVKYALGTPAAGTKVTITGTNLSGVSSAKIGGATATVGTKTATSLQLTLPAGTGVADIVVTTADGDFTLGTITYVGAGASQTVVANAGAATAVVGDADRALTSTVTLQYSDAGNGGAVTWTSTTTSVCTIVAGKAHFIGAGTCTVKATAAAAGVFASGFGTADITVSKKSQTITVTPPAATSNSPEGFQLTGSATSGLALVYASTTPDVCSVDATGLVTATTVGSCVITANQAGNDSFAAAAQVTTTLTITDDAADVTPVVDSGNAAKPLVAPKTGAFVTYKDAQIGWNRAKGTLFVKIASAYTGPIKVTMTFKGADKKNYTCVANFGIVKAGTAGKKTLTSLSLCSGKTEKLALAALKKIPTTNVVKFVIARELRNPVTYVKLRNSTRSVYAKLG
ncbi:MAG: hypothetical protein RLZ71_257, partial [Actinomycetota bacterium]